MSVELRLPSITGATEAEQLSQIKSYLYQFIPQLQWALSSLETSTPSATETAQNTLAQKTSSSASLPASPEATFNSIKSLIIKSADIVTSYYEEINKELEKIYVAESSFSEYKDKTTEAIGDITTNVVTIESDLNGYKESNDITVSGLVAGQEVFDFNFNQWRDGVYKSLSDDVTNLRIDYDKYTSDFGDYQVATAAAIKQTATDIKDELYARVDKINTDIGNIKDTLIETNARIRTGKLYENENGPIYGVEVGQITEVDGKEVFNKYARFTAGKLSFYDKNDTEVAYISDYKLHITHAHVTGTLTLGKYVIDTSKGLALKWVGEGSD